MSVRVTDNTANVRIEGLRSASLGLRLVADAIMDSSTRRTPKRFGFLRRNVVKQVLGLHGQLRWQVNYAVYLETKQFKNYTTPGTGPHFAENAVKEVVARSNQYFRRAGV